ncbi:MAG: amino acid adenylation domain-containing protein [Calditrichaceae bacterium]
MDETILQKPEVLNAGQPDMNGDEVYVFPASFGQQRLWFLDQFEPGSPYYNIPIAFRLKGSVDLKILKKVIDEIVLRHESLRTTFTAVDGQPMQVITKQMKIPMPVISLDKTVSGEHEEQIIRLATEEARRPFNLEKGPLIRITVLKKSDLEIIALLTLHHIISDGWSMGILVSEITTLYEAFSKNRPSPLPELPIQYADYASWQKEYMRGDLLQKQLDYWKNHLGSNPPVLELPTDRSRPPVITNEGSSASISISSNTLEKLHRLNRREGVTMFMTLLSAFNALLYRYSGQTDICVGTPIANRTRGEVEGVIGLFINTLVLRTNFDDLPTFREFVGRTKASTLDAYENQDLPFEYLVDALQPERDMRISPLFQVMFILQNTPVSLQPVGELTLEMISVDMGTSTFDLTFSIAESEAGLNVAAEFNTDIFDKSTIERMLSHFRNLLISVSANPDISIANIPILESEERNRILREWNATSAEHEEFNGIHQIFESRVNESPASTAVVFREKSISYEELNKKANRLAHYLKKKRIGPDTPVAILMERSCELMIAVLGVLKSGAAYLPLDPSYPGDRLRYMLEDANAPMLICDDHLKNIINDYPGEIFELNTAENILADEPACNPKNTAGPENLVYLIYTSGSTGKSKGVMVSHANLINAYLAWEDAYELKSRARNHLQMASFSFDVFAGDWTRALCSGGKLVLAPREILLEATRLYDLMIKENIDTAEFVPAVLRNLADFLEENDKNLNFLRNLIAGSDIWYVEEYRRFNRVAGTETRLINSFGLTEATIDSSYFETKELDLPGDRLVPIGRPFANMTLYILDNHFEPVPVGVRGEIFVGGAGVVRGYLNRPDLTADRFIPYPYGMPGERFYRTGDVGRYLPDGNIEFLGRSDNQVKIRGFRVELGEIETALQDYDRIKTAAVSLREDSNGDKRLIAYYVTDSDATVSATVLKEYLANLLPDYMIPAAYISLEKLPLTPNGKIDRRALPNPDQNQILEQLTTEYVEPKTDTEKKIAVIVGDLLNIDEVGSQHNFFDLGGHSLLATQLVSRIKKTFDIEFPLRKVFEFPAVSGLALCVDEARLAGEQIIAPPILPVSRDRELPLSFAQQRLWFLDQLEPDSPFYNIPETYRIKGDLNIKVFEASFNEIIRRHESLRTVFITENGSPTQKIFDEYRISMKITDLKHMKSAGKETEILRIAREKSLEPISIDKLPLFHIELLKIANKDFAVILVIHHIISDNWSSQVMMRELSIIYDAFLNKRPSPLAEVKLQYADFAHWQRGWLKGDILDEQLKYWEKQLTGIPPVLELPTDRPRSAMPTFKGAYLPFSIDKNIADRVKKLSHDENATLFMVLLAAFQTLLYRYTNEKNICVGTPIANRNRPEIEGIVGFFVNTLVMRANLSGEISYRQLIQNVRETALGAYAHQDVPFEKIVDAVQPERNTSHSPLFQVMFVILNLPEKSENESSDLIISPIEAHSGTSKFDITMFITEEKDRFSGALEYNTDLFDESTISVMLDHFQNLLNGLTTNPDEQVGRINMISEREHDQLLFKWNGKENPLKTDLPVHQIFSGQVMNTPDQIALELGELETFTYRQLHEASNRLANYLISLGVGPDVPVGLCMKRSTDLIVSVLGVLKAGGAYVPIDPSYPEDRLAFIIEDSGVPILLTHSALLPRLSKHILKVVCLDSEKELISSQDLSAPDVNVYADHLAYLIYTSGSTGKPKGTLITHRGLTNYLNWCIEAYPLTDGRGSLVHSTLAFDATVTAVFTPLLTGKTITLLPDDTDLEDLSKALIAYKDFSLIKITPAHLDLLSHQIDPMQAAGLTRAFVIGGENLTSGQIAFWQKNAPDTLLLNEYGPTETVVGCVVFEAQKWRGTGSVPIGQAISNARVYVLDEFLNPVPAGISGELYIGGEGVARGYLYRPDLTAARFIPDAFSGLPGERLYKTGDRVRYLRNGNLEFIGRLDDQVKIRGYRIEPGEIEAVLLQHKSIDEITVLAREDEPGKKRLVAYFTCKNSNPPSITELREFLAGTLPEYMIPSYFISVSEIPLTLNGKVDRKALPIPEIDRKMVEHEFIRPVSEKEVILAEIWKDVLGLNEVSTRDNFFELGGDSIISIQVIARANQAGIRLSPRQFFQYPTIEKLASVADSGVKIDAEQGVVTGQVPLTPILHWFFEQNLSHPNHYNQSLLLEVSEKLDPDILSKTIDTLIHHHDALRLRFVNEGTGWKGSIAEPDKNIPFEYIDLSTLDKKQFKAELHHLCEKAQASLEISTGPVLKAVYFSGAADSNDRLLMVIHHLAVDGVSWRILMDDFQSVYTQHLQNGHSDLPGKTTSFKSWAEKVNSYASSDPAVKDSEFWLEQRAKKAGEPVIDFSNGANDEKSVQTVSVSLPENDTESLLKKVLSVYRTGIDDILLTSLAVVLSEWMGETTVSVDLESHGRESLFDDVDLSRTVGWFTNIYPVYISCPPDTADKGRLIKSIKEQLHELRSRSMNYGVLRYLTQNKDIEYDRNQSPKISFNYLGQFDQHSGSSDNNMFLMAGENRGAERSPSNTRSHLIDITATIAGGRLQLEWSYSRNFHKKSTIEDVANRYLTTLKDIISHCLSAAAGGVSPSDFPLASIDQAYLDRIYEANPLIEDIYPLSPMQQGMLFHSLMSPETEVYSEQLSCKFTGELDPEMFKFAWQKVSERHEVLRSAYIWKGLDRPLQIVYKTIDIPFTILDWSGDSADKQKSLMYDFLSGELKEITSMANAPLMRIGLIRLDKNTHYFVWSHHHLLFDGWGTQIILKEIFELYESLSKKEPVSQELSTPYREYISWLQKRDMELAKTFWKTQLAGFTSPTPLPVKMHKSDSPYGYSKERVLLSPRLSESLGKLARENQLTMFTLIQGAWSLLLNRYSSENDVVFGATVSGRPAEIPGVESMVGLFINTLPVRIFLNQSDTLVEWLQKIQSQQAEMRQYEFTPLVDIQGWTEVPRGLPLFESIVVFENFPVNTSMNRHQNALEISEIESFERTNYPLTIVASPGDHLAVEAAYQSHLFSKTVIKRMLGHLETIFSSMASNPNLKLSEIPILTPSETQTMVSEWNQTGKYFPDMVSIHLWFEAQVEKSPEAIAVKFGDYEITYSALNAKANQLGRYLIKQSVKREELVGICLNRSVEMVIAALAILKAGGAYVPIDPAYPKERISYMLEDAKANILLTERSLAAGLPENLGHRIYMDEIWDIISDESSENINLPVFPENMAYVIYTSGSTGKPKGTMLHHGGLCNTIHSLIDKFSYTPKSRVLQFASFSFDASVEEVFATICSGGCLIIVNRESLLAPAEFIKLINSEKISKVLLPPSLLSILPEDPMPSLKTIVSGGEACTRGIASRWYKNRIFINGYGPTESTIVAAYHRVSELPDSDAIPIGRPIDNIRLYVLDPFMNPLPVGIPGELYIGGPGLARGYLDKPHLTAEKFVPNPFDQIPGSRLYRTGDLVRYLDGGDIEYLDRIDNQIKIRGFRIELGEIESLLRKVPGVTDSAVIVREDSPGDKRLTAYIIIKDNSDISTQQIRNALKNDLPEFMIPGALIRLEKFPLLPNGKVNRKALPSPELDEIRIDEDHIAPRGSIELKLVRIWREILNIPIVGITDNFFDLGGHSLLAIRVIDKIQQEFDREIPLVSLFSDPTIENLAKLLTQEVKSDNFNPLVELKKGTASEPVYFIHPTGGSAHWYIQLAELLHTRRPVYGIQARGFDGKLDLHTTIESMASYYVDAVRRQQPEGPYFLAGWSFGVIVAFEMGRQFSEMNQEVGFLGILDSGPYIPHQEEPKDDSELLQKMFSSHFELDAEMLREMEYDEQLKFVLKIAKKEKVLPRFIRQNQFKLYVHINKIQTGAWRKYKPLNFNGKITLFRADENRDYDNLPDDLGWKKYAGKGVDIINVPGDHITMMTKPNVKILAEKIGLLLDNLDVDKKE